MKRKSTSWGKGMHILVLNNLPHYTDPQRWDFRLVDYGRSLRGADVSYICDGLGVSAVPVGSDPQRVRHVEKLTDERVILETAGSIISAFGPIDWVFAFSEGLQDIAAIIRQRFEVAGSHPDAIRKWRDKCVMKEMVAKANLCTPRFIRGNRKDPEIIKSLSEIVGYPLVVKPIDGHSSNGVSIVKNSSELKLIIDSYSSTIDWEVEEYIGGDIFHVDGMTDENGRIQFARASKYYNNCLDFTRGYPLGSSLLDVSDPLSTELIRFAQDSVWALSLSSCPFHLEIINDPKNGLTFLEMGGRVGGADVAPVIYRATGVNLYDAWLKRTVAGFGECKAERHLCGGWLMFPRPPQLPVRVHSATSFAGSLPSLYAELVPTSGSILTDQSGYSSLQAGRFLFCAENPNQVESDMHTIAERFRLDWIPYGGRDEH